MLPGFRALRLSPVWETVAPLVLAPRGEALQMCRERGWEELPAVQALRAFDWGYRSVFSQLRFFLASSRLARLDMRELQDHEVREFVRGCIRNGDVLVLRQGRSQASTPNETLELRRLVAQIERQTRGKLPYRGRQYKLVPGDDLPTIPGRDSYEVVSQTDARRVLEGLAHEAGAPVELLAKAEEKISKDWRPPISQPDGLALLRRLPVQSAATKDDGPAITPSQMRALLDAEKPVTFFARFVDEFGKGLSGFTAQLAHGSDPDRDMSFTGDGFATVALKGERQARLTLPDDATEDLIDALKERWQEIRGEVDEAWKAKEKSLTEVLFRKGTLPRLQLEAEKKHTFMLRPPVALAHMHGTYCDTNKCFLLPSAVASLKRLPEIYELHPDSELLIVGHTDTAGSDAYNLELSADRADAMRAYLRNDADAWLAWYESSVREGKRWGDHEDSLMIDSLVPDDEFGGGNHIAAYQTWHNGDTDDPRQPGQERKRPDAWEALKVDGIMGPNTRRQLVLDYMSLDGTSLPDDVRVVTYGCGEQFPLVSEDGDVDACPADGQDIAFDRRVEVFFFAKPFGILPRVYGVGDGESPDEAVQAPPDDDHYPEWRLRATHRYAIDAAIEGFRLRLCDLNLVPYAERPFSFCLDGYPEIRGTTDKEGFAIVDTPPAGAQGTIEVWPDDAEPDDKIRWDISIAAIISPATPRGASTRLFNLDFFADDPTNEMTDELREAVRYFQGDCDGLEVTGELDKPTCERLVAMHDCEGGEDGGDDADSVDDASPGTEGAST